MRLVLLKTKRKKRKAKNNIYSLNLNKIFNHFYSESDFVWMNVQYFSYITF